MSKLRQFVLTLWAITSLSVCSIATALPVTQQLSGTTEKSCGFFNTIEIPDPSGDATLGSPPYVDILSVNIRQIGPYVQFELLLGGNPHHQQQYYFLMFDTDRNSVTGQRWGGVGAELFISIETFTNGSPAMVELSYFDANGEAVRFERAVPVVIIDNGFIFNIEQTKIPSAHFNLYFEASGFPPWGDEGTITGIQLQASEDPVQIHVKSSNSVLESKPTLINIPNKSKGVQLLTSLVGNGSTTPLEPSQVSYKVSHPESHVIFDPEAIISIDMDGVAHYNSEGYVTAWATVDACHLNSEKFVLATGDVYGDSNTDDVIAIFPTEYVPDSSDYSFGDMMSGYPDMMRYLNIAYDVTSEMYEGFHPFKGDKQILAPLVLKNHCGGSGNPMATAPCCYMNCGDASPQYEVIIHEMGHNFADSKGMRQLLESNNGRIDAAGFGECVGSLPVIYFEEEISHNGAAYDIYPGSFEYDYSKNYRDYYCAEPQRGLPEFEQLITDGLSDGIFDNNGLFGGVHVFCSFFEAFSCDYIGGENQYKHQMIRRFLHIFGDTELPEFIPEKVETYFAAAYSVAAGRDMRTRLGFWGFTIDDTYYEQIKPLIELKVQNFQVNASQSGSWYDPAHDGEGYVLQILSSDSALVYWFTYDKNGKQRWMIGVGKIKGSKIIFDEMLTTSGGKFGPDFNPEDVVHTAWGTLELEFSDCDHAIATYQGPSEFGSGSLYLQRLSRIWGESCDGSNAGPSGTGTGLLNPGFTGSWYDPAHDGEGFTVEILDEKTALIYWFTYDTQGNQAWMLSVARIDQATIVADDVLKTSGGKFGPDFDPADVVKEHWGEATFNYQTCANPPQGDMSYEPPPDFGPASTQYLHRLASIDGLTCGFLSGP